VPVTLRTTSIPNSVSTRSAALSTRIRCVLGLTKRHTKRQSVTTSVMRKTKDIIPPAIEVLYPILPGQVKDKVPILTGNIPQLQPAMTFHRRIDLLKSTQIFTN